MQVIEDYIPFKFDIIDDISRVDESAQSEVAKSGGTILAIVKGPHFCPGKVSRNHRLYTEELWEAVSKDEEVQRKLANGQMFGRVGHEAEITDEDIGAGNYSHITRNIDWKTGIAESVIFNTPMGNNLYTLLRAGTTTMYVSSRADGDYCGKDDDDNDILDPKTYKLERFDFVQDPGFLDAKPKLISESKKKDEELKETVGEKVAESLLNLAMEVGAPLELDGATYSVEKVCESKVDMSDCNTMTSDTYTLSDFTEVTEDMRKGIVEHFNNQQRELEESRKELDEAHQLIKTLRFANRKGLDEEYVEKRMREGASLESIEREHPTPQPFKVVEAKFNKAKDDEYDTLDYLLGFGRK